jgi:prepilin-type N-terminal cleavage/methylation domain-containing protein
MVKNGFTLIEIVVVMVIIGILTTLSIIHYISVRELALDKEAIMNLKVLQAAEKSYCIDMNSYYPSTGSTSNIADIISNLKVSISVGSPARWIYTVFCNGCSRAVRNGSDGRGWFLTINDTDGEPNKVTATDNCPSACP